MGDIMVECSLPPSRVPPISDNFFQSLLKHFDERLEKEQKRFDELLESFKKEQKEWRQEATENASRIAKLESNNMMMMDEKLKIEQKFNTRGALERIAYVATLHNLITVSPGDGVQKKLNAVAARPDFQNILKAVVKSRKLVLRDVEHSIGKLYYETSRRAHGNVEPITIREKDFSPNEVAALVAFMKWQGTQGKNGLKWKVEQRE